MDAKKPVVVACSTFHPLVVKGLSALLKHCDVRSALDTSNGTACTEEPADLIIRYAPSTLYPLPHPRCVHQDGGTPILFLSQGWVEMEEAIRHSGITGYVGPNASPEQVLEAVRAVLSGRRYYNPGNSTRMPVGRLSKRQVEVLALVARGMTDQEIAARLHIGASTVRHHLEMLHIKLCVERRAEIAAAAALAGLSAYNSRGPLS